MITQAPASFPAPDVAYSRDNESQFRAQVKAALAEIRASVNSLPISGVFFNVRDYVASGTAAAWDDAFLGAETDAVAADGIVLIPPGSYALVDDFEFTAAIMFAGGVVKPASGKTLTVSNTLTALAGEWFDASAGGLVVRPHVSNQENGASFDGSVILGPNQKLILDGLAAADAEEYLIRPSAGVLDIYAGDDLALRLTDTLLTILSGADLKLGVAAAAAVAVASTHKVAVKDNTGTTYYLLATNA